MYTIKLISTEISVHAGNICSDVQGAWTSPRSVNTPWTSEQIFTRMDLMVYKHIVLTLIRLTFESEALGNSHTSMDLVMKKNVFTRWQS